MLGAAAAIGATIGVIGAADDGAVKIVRFETFLILLSYLPD
jgi:hypothetical protein